MLAVMTHDAAIRVFCALVLMYYPRYYLDWGYCIIISSWQDMRLMQWYVMPSIKAFAQHCLFDETFWGEGVNHSIKYGKCTKYTIAAECRKLGSRSG